MESAATAYLESRDCLLAIRSRIDALTSGIDPAPWYIASPAALPGDNETPNVRQMAVYERANLTFFRAMLVGSLRGWFLDGGERWQIPGWAWADQGGDWRALIIGNDFLHPLAPPEVRRWAWLPVQVERAEFMRWLGTDEIADQTDFPELPPAYDEASRPPYVTRLELPDRPNVSLAHALSWLAFGISLDAQSLASALGAGVLGASRTDAHRRLEQATDRLVTAGTGGLPMLGKFVPMHGDYGAALTARIEPERLEDFRQFDVTFDGLRYGTGVSWDWTDPGVTSLARVLPATTHRFVDVKVDRQRLMALQAPDQSADDGARIVIEQVGCGTASAIYDTEQRVDRSRIGNQRQQDDNLIAVSDAVRLGDCCRLLTAMLEREELAEGDYLPEQLAMYKAMRGAAEDAASSAWIKACIMADKAVSLIRQAISDGQLRMWRIHDAREVQFAPIVLDRENVKSGIFKSLERPEPEAQGACLWVKASNWDRFVHSFMPAEAVTSSVNDTLPSDEAIVGKMHELIAGGMRRDDAAKHIRELPGFGAVQNEHARRVVRGTLPRGRPKSSRAAEKAAG